MTFNAEMNRVKEKKDWFFAFFLIGSWLFLSVALFVLWRLTLPGFQQIHPLLPWIVGVLLAGALFLIGLGILLLFKTLIVKCYSWYSFPIQRLMTRYLFPLMVIVGRIFRIPDERLEQSFISINNKLVQIRGLTVRPERMMILLPQCLQNNDCTMRLTKDIRGCKRCGKCQIAEIIPLLDKYKIMCWVATGGTLARKYIAEYRPDAIIAIACPRDLSSGIVDCFPIPVYGILNQRPEGPCINTIVNMDKIKWALKSFLIEDGQ